jgi:hypothetical protein
MNLFSKKIKRESRLFNAIKALIEEANPDFKIPTNQPELKVVHINEEPEFFPSTEEELFMHIKRDERNDEI